jgi:hypothetical protein
MALRPGRARQSGEPQSPRLCRGVDVRSDAVRLFVYGGSPGFPRKNAHAQASAAPAVEPAVPAALPPVLSDSLLRRRWAMLIKRVSRAR